jgi:hypothetical protein
MLRAFFFIMLIKNIKPMSKKLEILKNSLLKKEQLFDDKLQNHFDTVKQSNGQPLNDKRNGQATLNKWDRQNESLRTLKESIEKTKTAIENEESKINSVLHTKKELPSIILEYIEKGILIVWRKHPNTFFVKGVDKARLYFDLKKKILSHKYTNQIIDKEQWKIFAKTFNELRVTVNCP